MKKVFKVLIISLIICCFISLYLFFCSIRYPIEIMRKQYSERIEEIYNGKFENIKEDGFIGPVIYTISQRRLEQFIKNHSVDVFDGINPHNGLGESVYTYKVENGIVEELSLNKYPYIITKDTQFNIGQFYIDEVFLNFYSKENIKKILEKNGVDIDITKITLLNLTKEIDNTDTLIAWIECSDKNYFLTWDKCRKSIDRFKKNAIKYYFQSDDYNYFTLYNDEAFCDEFKCKKANLIKNDFVVDNNTNIYHSYASMPLFKILENSGFTCDERSEENLTIKKNNISYRINFNRNNEWGTVFSLKIYNEFGNQVNDYSVCELVDGEYMITDEEYNKLSSIFQSRVKVDYENIKIEIVN